MVGAGAGTRWGVPTVRERGEKRGGKKEEREEREDRRLSLMCHVRT